MALWQFANKDIQKKKPSIQPKGYRLIYTDQKGNFDREKVIVSEMLVSKRYDLRGKPDFVFMNKSKRELMPVELKSGKIGNKISPHRGDFMQLIAYFVMLEDIFGIRPKEGRIVYSDSMFVIKNTDNFRKEFFLILSNMRDMLKSGEAKAEASFVKCRYCICNGTVCKFCKN